jgi:hypothetical protein
MKCRRTHYDTLIIEKKKWDYLADIRARTGARTLYINATPKGVYQFDLGALEAPEWHLKALPDKTDFVATRLRNSAPSYQSDSPSSYLYKSI